MKENPFFIHTGILVFVDTYSYSRVKDVGFVEMFVETIGTGVVTRSKLM